MTPWGWRRRRRRPRRLLVENPGPPVHRHDRGFPARPLGEGRKVPEHQLDGPAGLIPNRFTNAPRYVPSPARLPWSSGAISPDSARVTRCLPPPSHGERLHSPPLVDPSHDRGAGQDACGTPPHHASLRRGPDVVASDVRDPSPAIRPDRPPPAVAVLLDHPCRRRTAGRPVADDLPHRVRSAVEPFREPTVELARPCGATTSGRAPTRVLLVGVHGEVVELAAGPRVDARDPRQRMYFQSSVRIPRLACQVHSLSMIASR